MRPGIVMEWEWMISHVVGDLVLMVMAEGTIRPRIFTPMRGARALSGHTMAP
jgi:hypothetical protein